MENWKQSLDNYLTSAPEDNFTPWVENLLEQVSDEFYRDAYENRTDFENSELESKWLDKLNRNMKYHDLDDNGNMVEFGKYDLRQAAKVFERAYQIYVK